MEIKYQAWFEKYRPRTIEETVLPDSVKKTITEFYNDGFIRGNILSYGKAGLGKTTINKLLINKIIKTSSDLMIPVKSADGIRKLKDELIFAPKMSVQKIVNIEEMDKLKADAQTLLKDGMMENYQDYTSFLATTNNLEKLDDAILTRFNIKINFSELNKDEILNRLKMILTKEQVKFQEKDLKNFLEKFYEKGIRDMINNLELYSSNNLFNMQNDDEFLDSDKGEEDIVKYVIYLFTLLEKKSAEEIKSMLNNTKSNPELNQYYDYICKLIFKEMRLNYDYLFKRLIEDSANVFEKNIIIGFYSSLESKSLKQLHLISLINTLMIYKYEKKGGAVTSTLGLFNE